MVSLININNMRSIVNSLFLVSVFFVVQDSTVLNWFYLIYIVLSIVIYMLEIREQKIRSVIKFQSFYAIIIFLASFLVAACLSQHGVLNIILTSCVLFIAYINFCNLGKHEYRQRYDVFYILVNVILVFHLLIAIFMQGGDASSLAFSPIWDKNYSSVFMLLYLVYCKKQKHIIGIILSIIYIIFLESRLIYISLFILIVLYIIMYFKKSFFSKLAAGFIRIRPFYIVCLISFLTIITTVVSFYVTYNLPSYQISAYKETLHDTSNAVRVRSNVFAINEIEDNDALLISGYGADIRSVIGATGDQQNAYFLDYRIVQPHNFILNFFLRFGIFYTVCYVWLLAIILCRYWSKENIPIFIVYLIVNMAMHSLLSGVFLIFFIFVLATHDKRSLK